MGQITTSQILLRSDKSGTPDNESFTSASSGNIVSTSVAPITNMD